MDLLTRLFGTRLALRRWALGALVGNIALVVTGGIVRVTSSGLGCPTWPKCFPDSYVATPESGLHGAIEFGNRLLTFVLAILAIGTVVSAIAAGRRGGLRPAERRPYRILVVLAALGIPLQAVVGGLSVLFQLNPWVVGLHMVLSVALIAAYTWAVDIAYERRARPTPAAGRRLVLLAAGLTGLVILLGTVTTGAGPHAGDGGARRNGLDLEAIARIHALSVWALVGVTVLAWLVTRSSAVLVLLAVELAQGLIGYVQYFTHLPAALVIAHLLGVAASTWAATWVVLRHGRRIPVEDAAERLPATVG